MTKIILQPYNRQPRSLGSEAILCRKTDKNGNHIQSHNHHKLYRISFSNLSIHPLPQLVRGTAVQPHAVDRNRPHGTWLNSYTAYRYGSAYNCQQPAPVRAQHCGYGNGAGCKPCRTANQNKHPGIPAQRSDRPRHHNSLRYFITAATALPIQKHHARSTGENGNSAKCSHIFFKLFGFKE
jgi:hypothetical protein